jgi:hypothetical protein
VSLGQVDYLEHLIAEEGHCTCGRLVHDCAFWSRVLSPDSGAAVPRMLNIRPLERQTALSLVRKGVQITLAMFGRSRRRASQDIDRAWHLLDRVAEEAGKPVVVDSSKGLIRLLMLDQGADTRPMRMIHLVRAPLGVVASTSSERQVAAPDGTLRTMRTLSKSLATVTWIVQNILVLTAGFTRFRGRYMVVLYEDLVEKPEATLEAVCRFLGMSFERSMLPPIPPGNSHLIGGNPTRYEGYSKLVLDTRWRDRLSALESALISVACAPIVFVTRWLSRRHARRLWAEPGTRPAATQGVAG